MTRRFGTGASVRLSTDGSAADAHAADANGAAPVVANATALEPALPGGAGAGSLGCDDRRAEDADGSANRSGTPAAEAAAATPATAATTAKASATATAAGTDASATAGTDAATAAPATTEAGAPAALHIHGISHRNRH
ncbi:hypothetical protein [Phreatobacter sp.]|uniref:hypothetical protein n=1 Tax=Phreatobacter sp. TaxID=1966341 RepID=UPI003F70E146